MDIATLQKKLEEESKALESKAKFVTELQALLKKYGQTEASLLALLRGDDVAVTPVKRGRKPAAKKAVDGSKPKTRKKQAKRPLRKFKNPQTGEVAQTRAPQVDKTIKNWAQALKVDWRTLEI